MRRLKQNARAGNRHTKKPSPVILVVDDDVDNRQMLRCLLEIWRFSVVEAENGAEAAGIAEELRPDLILMDVRMPLIDGFDAARLIRGSTKAFDVPILFLSGCAEDSYREAADAAGANEYLIKPLDFRELEKTVAKYLSHKEIAAASLARPKATVFGRA
jgi:CheY-like chemotaxis protein